MKSTERSYSRAIHRPHNGIRTEKTYDGKGEFFNGTVKTSIGIIDVRSKFGAKPYTLLTFVHEGRIYNRTFQNGFSKRHLVTLAVRLAEEVITGQFKESR